MAWLIVKVRRTHTQESGRGGGDVPKSGLLEGATQSLEHCSYLDRRRNFFRNQRRNRPKVEGQSLNRAHIVGIFVFVRALF